MSNKLKVNTNEKILWKGKPKSGIVFRLIDIYLTLFSTVWLTFSIYWYILALKSSILFSFFGIPFIVIGVIMLFGRYYFDAKNRENTEYIITDNRILISFGERFNQNYEVELKNIKSISVSNHPDGYGTIYLGKKKSLGLYGMDWFTNRYENFSLELEVIPKAIEVFNIIKENIKQTITKPMI